MKYIALALLVSLYFNYKLSEENSILEALVDGQSDVVSVEKAGISRSIPKHAAIEDKEFYEDEPEVITKKAKTADKKSQNDSDEEGEYFEDFGEVQMAWITKMQDHLEYNLGLTADEFAKYVEIKAHRQKEIDNYFKERLDKLPKADEKKGQGRFIIHTPEHTIALGKINDKYAKKLQALLGTKGYQSYLGMRDSFNQGNLPEDSNSPMYIIEF